MRVGAAMLMLILVGLTPASAQSTAQSTDDGAWSLSAAAFVYVPPDEANYVQPTVTADRRWFHAEARYNYEEQNTGSLWAGFNFGGGKTVEWAVTPMVGGVFGDATGVAPGYNGSLTWGMLDIYSEGEWVIDTGESSDSFLYNWSELAFAPTELFRIGLVTQRTRVYQTDREIQRGLLFGLSYENLEATTYVFNPDDSSPTVVFSVGWSFTLR